jgi:hypothetical protein
MDKHFSLVSQKTRDALKEEGRFIMMFPLVYHVDAPSISTFSTRFHFYFLGGLFDLPKRWWTSTQKIIFAASPEDPRQVKLSTSHVILICFPNLSFKMVLETEVILTDHRANVILENYRMAGISFYLANVVKKYAVQPGTLIQKCFFGEQNVATLRCYF